MHGAIDHVLRLAISALIVLATILLGWGEHNAALPAASLVLVMVSAYVTDYRGWFQLNQRAADCAALGVIALSAFNAYHADRAGQLFVMAHLQSYLQYVLLFQPKSTRLYWQLALLSFGQMAIASTLLSGPSFAILAVAYLFLGVFAFALLVLSAEVRRQCSVGSFEAQGAQIDDAAQIARKSVSLQPPALVLVGSTAAVDSHVMVRGVLRQSALVSVLSVIVATCLFFVLPRWDVPNREIATTEPLRTVGFSKKVTLGELGEVVNNPDVVMRIQLFHAHESRPFRLIGEPLFRGSSVTRYENGSWTQANRKNVIVMPTDFKSPFVRQRITAEPLDVAELFCVFPVFAFQPDYRLRVDSAAEELIRQEDYRGKQLEFEIGTSGIVDDRQRAIVPCERRLRRSEIDEMLQMPAAQRGGTDPFNGLRALAAGILEQRGISAADQAAAAQALSDHFGSSGRYLYSLDAQSRDARLDPLEDFVTGHRLGHCEYFAGALVMMLRSQGIPARMAIGFKGGEWNSLGMYYQVQQLHAHAWVEVFLERNQIPPNQFAEDEMPRAAWLTLDPTEGTQEAYTAALRGGIMARFRQYLDYGQVLWTNYVVGLNYRRQRQGIYEPLAQGASAAVDSVVSPQVWQERARWVSNSPIGAFWAWYRLHWFSWRGGLVAAGFSLLTLGAYAAIRWLAAVARRWGLGARGANQDPPVLEIYRRLEAALAARGLERARGQTAHEFAVMAGGELSERVEDRRVAHLPRRIIDAFYRVRFGNRTLDNLEVDSVEHALLELERVLARSS